MNAVTLALIVVSQLCLVTGQLVIKHAMNLTHHAPKPWARIVPFFALGIGVMTIAFFLWLGFLQRLELSHVFPFEGLSPMILVLGASVFLHEKIDARCWAGVGLLSTGMVLVGLS